MLIASGLYVALSLIFIAVGGGSVPAGQVPPTGGPVTAPTISFYPNVWIHILGIIFVGGPGIAAGLTERMGLPVSPATARKRWKRRC